ncbi:enoyl-CoA hydratase/isomerase family protein [uncultured Piscinibacter sp.]|uniref:enoyl-CoA hydratase/isomerase family protein n=1 Tax=uncultured Piscinibacter sp. TaxID=1131835 RepID=UPI00260E4AD1|nr:enoyl-CoA hydratase/isomerase family protein [uncultured Piscinibacter sp.]
MSRLDYATRDGVAWVRLCRPEARNAIDDDMDAALARAWQQFESDASVRVAVLHGEGPAFCAGADLKSVIPRWADATPAMLRANVACGLGGGLTRGRHRLRKPVIAAVHGHAVGAGFELALACDIRVAADDATFGAFEIRHGLHAGDGGLVRLVAIAGAGVALDLALTGRPVGADEALRLRLVSRVVSRDQLLAEAARTAAAIARHSGHAVASAKETILDLIGRPLDDALRLEALNGYTSFGHADALRRALPSQDKRPMRRDAGAPT